LDFGGVYPFGILCGDPTFLEREFGSSAPPAEWGVNVIGDMPGKQTIILDYKFAFHHFSNPYQ